MEQRELKAMLLTAPRNYFEEMIQWTEKGLIWRFPIDNEQGIIHIFAILSLIFFCETNSNRV